MSEKDGDRYVEMFQDILDQQALEKSRERLRRATEALQRAKAVWLLENTSELPYSVINLN